MFDNACWPPKNEPPERDGWEEYRFPASSQLVPRLISELQRELGLRLTRDQRIVAERMITSCCREFRIQRCTEKGCDCWTQENGTDWFPL